MVDSVKLGSFIVVVTVQLYSTSTSTAQGLRAYASESYVMRSSSSRNLSDFHTASLNVGWDDRNQSEVSLPQAQIHTAYFWYYIKHRTWNRLAAVFFHRVS